MSPITESSKYIYCKSLKDIKRNLLLFKNSQYGSNSNIYIYKIKELLKVFKDVGSTADLNSLEKLKLLNTKSIVTPIKFLFINDQYYGFSMQRAKGNMFLNIHPDTNIKEWLKSLSIPEKDLKTISEHGFIADDLNVCNFIYNPKTNTSKIIDCNSLILLESNNPKETTLINELNFYVLVLTTLTNRNFFEKEDNNFLNYIKDVLLNRASYEVPITSFYNSIIELLENEVDKKISTIGDFRKALILSNE